MATSHPKPPPNQPHHPPSPQPSPPPMSAPSIPNLLSLRGSRGGGRGGRGRGRGTGGTGGPETTSDPRERHDTTIQGTDTDAAVSRLSAVDLGYLSDPYARYFVQSGEGRPARRLPIINRGTYTRTAALDALVDNFISSATEKSPRQVVSLGAGTDTRPFRLFAPLAAQDSNDDGEGIKRRGLVYHEVDFPVISHNKFHTVQKTPALNAILTQTTPVKDTASWSGQPVTGGEYYCHGLDLRDLSSTAAPRPSTPSLTLPHLRTDIPTLVLSECCLCYLPAPQARDVLSFFRHEIASDLAVALYEPIQPDDAFGRQMAANLAARGIRMPTVAVYPDGTAQEARLRRDAGLERAAHRTVEDLWEGWVSCEERERVDALEGLDEVEEWKLLAAHYVVAWSSRGPSLVSWGVS